jgi:phage tail tube protein FII
MASGTQSIMVGTPIPATITIGTGHDTLALRISEDAYLGDAQFTVSVDGVQVGGVQTAMATHADNKDQTFIVLGNWGVGNHTVSVDFLNDLYAGTPQTDRNLYVDGASYDGTAAVGTLALLASGTQSITVGTPIPATITIGTGNDTLALRISEDAYLGDAQFTVSVDGVQVGGVQTAMATRADGQDQTFDVLGNWGVGSHNVAVDFLNDLYAGTPQTDRNLYVDGASYDGTVQPGDTLALLASGTQSFSVVSSTTYTEGSAGGSLTTVGNDTVQIGSGAVQINAEGPSVNVVGGSGAMTFIAHGGNDTISAGSGATTVSGSTGSLTFIDGVGNSNVTLGSGPGVFDFINGMAGGALTINDFIPGTDLLHLEGYSGTGIASEQVNGVATVITLTDTTKITLTGAVSPYPHSLFG